MEDIQAALANGASVDDMPTVIERAWCKKHPTGYLGKNRYGYWYTRCYTGFKHNEECEIVIEKWGVRV